MNKGRIGFIQGRLSEPVDGKIQAFPWASWRVEFDRAQHNGFHLIEWTIDRDRFCDQPLFTEKGRNEIHALCAQHDVAIPSLTGDCLMQLPFWKAAGPQRDDLEAQFGQLVAGCAKTGISTIVVPLVDNGRIDDPLQAKVLHELLGRQQPALARANLRVAFESDFPPTRLADFIREFDPAHFGINYDTGNSAAAGFDPTVEISTYGHRIINVHVKDRKLGGGTVPIGQGNADFNAVFASLANAGYAGNYILQTARAVDGDHVGALCRYRDLVVSLMERYGS